MLNRLLWRVFKSKGSWLKSGPPEHFTDFILVAISDARRLNRKKYNAHFASWHNIDKTGKCKVSLAGAFMAKSLRMPIDFKVEWDEFCYTEYYSHTWGRAYIALSTLRIGEMANSIRWYYDLPKGTPVRAKEHLDTLEHRHTGKGMHKGNYKNWDEFLEHLDYLEKVVVPVLRKGSY